MPTIVSKATDDFNRANENPLSGGGNWIMPTWAAAGRNWQVITNFAAPVSSTLDCWAIYTGRTWTDAQSSKAALKISGSSGGFAGVGLLLRCSSATPRHTYRFVTDHAASLNCDIRRYDATTSTSLSNFTQAWTDGDTWQFTAEGSPGSIVLTAYLNGSQVQQITDTDGTNGIASGYPGLAFSSTDTGPQADNWDGGEFDYSAVPNLEVYATNLRW